MIRKIFKNLNLILLACSIIFLNACSPADLLNNTTNTTKAASTIEELYAIFTEAMERNEHTIKVELASQSLIDTSKWVNELEGINKATSNTTFSFNKKVATIELIYWDYYAIKYAHTTNDFSYLTDKQRLLYNEYLRILDLYTENSLSDYENELAIHDYLVKNLTYDLSVGANYNAYDALINKKSVCGGYAECFMTFMMLLDIPCHTISGTGQREEHIWNIVCLDGQWYHVDVTWDDPINEIEDNTFANHTYFNITEAEAAQEHSWNAVPSVYETANSYAYSYAAQSKLQNFTSQASLNNFIKSQIRSGQRHIEFTATFDADLNSALKAANVSLSYSASDAIRNNRNQYSICVYY